MFSKATDLSSLSIMEQNLYVAARNCYPWVLENPNRSLIELEIIQAAFLNESQFQYFYFRTGTMLLKPMDEEKEEMVSAGFLINNEEKLKIGKLKAKIISKGLPVRLYRDLHELGKRPFLAARLAVSSLQVYHEHCLLQPVLQVTVCPPDVRTVELISTEDEEAKLHIFRQYLPLPSKDPF
uniref:Tetratricopeptide repeat protein 41 isoform X3 n=1 Tax=Tursiops truncatus TaxID=9739 RepID=A0A6J3S6C3_TURTR|nr:putative tetratricopeptide repeat protein 41 isoform X3 [Tursiops truncatus]